MKFLGASLCYQLCSGLNTCQCKCHGSLVSCFLSVKLTILLLFHFWLQNCLHQPWGISDCKGSPWNWCFFGARRDQICQIDKRLWWENCRCVFLLLWKWWTFFFFTIRCFYFCYIMILFWKGNIWGNHCTRNYSVASWWPAFCLIDDYFMFNQRKPVFYQTFHWKNPVQRMLSLQQMFSLWVILPISWL